MPRASYVAGQPIQRVVQEPEEAAAGCASSHSGSWAIGSSGQHRRCGTRDGAPRKRQLVGLLPSCVSAEGSGDNS
jgi:hypothetical protein